jgi:hypothetical protein
MTTPQIDDRDSVRRALDEHIATEPYLPPLEVSADAKSMTMETHRDIQRKQPLAIVGIVENGLVRPLDSQVKLAENSRVIIVAAE